MPAGTPDPRIDRYLSKDRPWREEMLALRRILLSEGLTETLRWRQPCYQAGGGNVALLAPMKHGCAVSFLKGALLDDPAGDLEAPGENSRSARFMRFAGPGDIQAREAALRAFIRAAAENERAGRKVDFAGDDLDLPEELQAALEADPDLNAAWAALTPGRRRGWVLHFRGAKKADTRAGRVTRARPRILEGMGIHDR